MPRRSGAAPLALAAIVVAAGLAAQCGASSRVALPDIGALTCNPATPRVAAQTPSTTAIATAAATEQTPLVGPITDLGHDAVTPVSTDTVTGAARRDLAQQLRAAATAACALRTTDDAARAGYVYASAYTQGVGVHWINWRLVNEPFDPARPSMLLYAPSAHGDTLVGFSYWVRADAKTPPAAFSGDADRWHRHFGLCFDATGVLEREAVRSPQLCDGPWINGSDLWMLHAWIVPGRPNPAGTFAGLDGALCSRTAPDISRCPGVG